MFYRALNSKVEGQALCAALTKSLSLEVLTPLSKARRAKAVSKPRSSKALKPTSENLEVSGHPDLLPGAVLAGHQSEKRLPG